MSRSRLTPYLLLTVLMLGTGLGIGLGLSEAPVAESSVDMTHLPGHSEARRAPCAGPHETPTSEDLTRAVLGIRAQAKAGVSSDQLGNFDITQLANRYGLCYSYTHQVQGPIGELDIYFLPGQLPYNLDVVAAFLKASPLFGSVRVLATAAVHLTATGG